MLTYFSKISWNTLAIFCTLLFSSTQAALPTITALSPNNGSSKGGNTVTITGTNLSNTSVVYFGSTPALIVPNTNTDSSIEVYSPAHSTETIIVNVSTPIDTSFQEMNG